VSLQEAINVKREVTMKTNLTQRPGRRRTFWQWCFGGGYRSY
jgi:hypothetical protein